MVNLMKLGWGIALGMTLGVANAQIRPCTMPVSISVVNNSTLLPGAGRWGVWGVPMHPGISIGTEFRYNRNEVHELFQSARLGYFYHRYVQHGIQLYSEFGYRFHCLIPLDVESRLGAGYLHEIPAASIFKSDDQGIYHKQHLFGKPQAMASLSLGTGYTFARAEDLRIFLLYQFYVQFPFVKEYVPFLPNTALHLGASMPISSFLK